METKGKVGLTPRQRDTLVFMRDYIAKNQCPPSYDEIMVALGLVSKSNVHRLVVALEARGYIRRKPRLQRSIALVE